MQPFLFIMTTSTQEDTNMVNSIQSHSSGYDFHCTLSFSSENTDLVIITLYLENESLPSEGDYITVKYNVEKRCGNPLCIGKVIDYNGNYDSILNVFSSQENNSNHISKCNRVKIAKRLKTEIAKF